MDQIVVTTTELLKKIVEDVFQEKLDSHIKAIFLENKPPPIHQDEIPLKTKQVLEILDIKVQTLIDWKKKGIIPFHKKGGRIYYYLNEINEAIRTPEFRSKTRRRSQS